MDVQGMVLATVAVQDRAMTRHLVLTICLLRCAPAQISIHLYDYAELSARARLDATAEAKRILRSGGVETEWVDCPCEGKRAAGALQLRILNREMADRTPAKGNALGYALVLNGSGRIASVFHDRSAELEKRNLAGRTEILGAMMAHEIGHLLLGENSHARDGIMRAVWDEAELRLIAQGRLLFSSQRIARRRMIK
jgi:hypothetical protein